MPIGSEYIYQYIYQYISQPRPSEQSSIMPRAVPRGGGPGREGQEPLAADCGVSEQGEIGVACHFAAVPSSVPGQHRALSEAGDGGVHGSIGDLAVATSETALGLIWGPEQSTEPYSTVGGSLLHAHW